MFAGGGSSQVSGANITDGSISNDDIASNAAVALSKLAGLVGDPATLLSWQLESDASVSVVTDGTQRLLVLAYGTVDGNVGGDPTINLKYDGVTKASAAFNSSGSRQTPWILSYTEVPSSGTRNVTVDGTTNPFIQILVIKLKVS